MFEIYGLRKKQRKGTIYFHIAVNLMCTFSYVNLIFSFLLCIFAVKLVILFWCKALNLKIKDKGIKEGKGTMYFQITVNLI